MPTMVVKQMQSLLVLAGTALILLTTPAAAQTSYKSAQDAVNALVSAVRAGNQRAVATVLGAGSAEIISSGDPTQDQNARAVFLAAFDRQHQITPPRDGQSFLLVGAGGWPFPIPLKESGGQWRYDTAAGREEILYRRIGRNELAAILTSLAYFDAQYEYAARTADGRGSGVYARRFVSSSGKKDGLYWPNAANEPQSPLGDAVARATMEGYRLGSQTPFHGYYYKILTRQGRSAPGGALNYLVQDKMIGGFGLLAYPAEYGNSGVKTLLINHDGTIFEKDLGPRTAGLARRISSFNPDHTWTKVPSNQ